MSKKNRADTTEVVSSKKYHGSAEMKCGAGLQDGCSEQRTEEKVWMKTPDKSTDFKEEAKARR